MENANLLLREVLQAAPGNSEALRLAVRLAALPLLTRALMGWSRRELPDSPEQALPDGIRAILLRQQALPKEVGTEQVDLARDTVLSFPWHGERMVRAVRGIRAWQYDPLNHRAALYRPLGVAFLENGFHSGAVGVLRREGTLPARVVDLAPILQAGLRVEWRDGKALAVLATGGGEVREEFAHPEYAVLWEAAHLLWAKGVSL